MAYHSEADVLGYGGAAGGGKSDIILGLALTQHRRSVIFRKESTQGLGMTDRALEIVGSNDGFNSVTGIWRNLPGGRQIEFAGLKNPGDEQKWKGRPHDFIGLDEADFILESQFRFVTGWLRTTDPAQRCRVVLGFNPPSTVEGRWIISYFGPWLDRKHPKPAMPGELRWYATLPDGKEVERPDGQPFAVFNKGLNRDEVIRPRSRTFIPARVTDNPYLMRTNYLDTVLAMPEPLRSQLAYGDFDAGVQDDAWQVIPTAWVEAAFARWTPTPPKGQRLSALGVDCARGGPALMTVCPRRAHWFGPIACIRGREITSGKFAAQEILKHHEPEADINIDMTGGWGSSPYDSLKEMTWLRAKVRAVNFAAGVELWDRSKRFPLVNVRAALYWRLREALDPEHGENLAICPDRDLLVELCAARYEIRSSGIILLPKEDIIEALGRSPDKADSLCLAHWYTGGYDLPDANLLPAPEHVDPYAPPQESESRAAAKGFFGRGSR